MKSSLSNQNLSRSQLNHSSYMAMMEQKTSSSQSASDCRTPIAWHNRSVNLSKPLSIIHSSQPMTPNYATKYRSASGKRLSQRPSSPSATTTSSDDREEVPMVRHHLRRPNSRVTTSSALTVDRRHHMNNKFGNHVLVSGEYAIHPMHAFRSGTLRSTKSVPTLAISALNDPCPVHGGNGHSHGNGHQLVMQTCPPHSYYSPIASQTLNFRRFGSFTDIRETRVPLSGNGMPFLAPIPEHKQSVGLMPVYYSQAQPSLPALPAPNGIPLHLVQPKAATRSMVFPAYSEPIHFRNFKVSSPVSPVPSHQTIKMSQNYGSNSDDFCCRGHLIVLWVILGVVTVGVISGIILAVTMN